MLKGESVFTLDVVGFILWRPGPVCLGRIFKGQEWVEEELRPLPVDRKQRV